MDAIFFKPHVGEKYGEGFNGKKILILGHSYPCNEKIGKMCPGCGVTPKNENCKEATIQSIEEYQKDVLKSANAKTFRNFEIALAGQVDSQIWNNVIFYNYAQRAFVKREPAQDPNGEVIRTGRCSKECYRFSAPIFVEVLKAYRPDYIIVWGEATHDEVIENMKYIGIAVDNLNYKLDDRDVICERLHIDTDYEVKILRMRHPSLGYNADYWRNVINSFFE